MFNNFYIYKFGEFELDEEEEKLFKKGKQIPLQPKAIQILLLLVENAGKIVKNDQILATVWRGEIVEESGINTRIRDIRKAIGQDKNLIFIQTEKKGFKFVIPVEKIEKPEGSLLTEREGVETLFPGEVFQDTLEGENKAPLKTDFSNQTEESEPHVENNTIFIALLGMAISIVFIYIGTNFWGCSSVAGSTNCPEQYIFIFLVAICYGILFGVGLLLECGYDFDIYGWNVSAITPPVILLNFGAMFSALMVAGSFLSVGVGFAFAAGLFLLILGAVITCILAKRVLPDIPITAAKFQTQPAFAAFCKNVFIYFLPAYTIFCLLVFCLIYTSQEIAKNIVFPIGFTIIFLLVAVFSYISTNYLSNNLLTRQDGEKYKYHGLFFNLLILRAIFCFGAPLGSIIWYFIQSINYLSPYK